MKKFYFSLIVVLVIIAGCSLSERHKVMTVLFDGVPELSDTELSAANDSLSQDSIELTDSSTIIVKQEAVYHPPFLNRQCTNCHNKETMGTFRKPQPDLCYQCHDSFEDEYGFTHAPVSAGFCTACHSPHVAHAEKLLLHTGRELCFSCHNETRILENKFHTKIGDADCTKCHNPHGGANRFILKSEICTTCHQAVIENYAYLHGPVNAGECSVCHGPHELTTDKKLLRNGQEICSYCHNSDQIFSNKQHPQNKSALCLKCHNPHGGKNKSFLKEV